MIQNEKKNIRKNILRKLCLSVARGRPGVPEETNIRQS